MMDFPEQYSECESALRSAVTHKDREAIEFALTRLCDLLGAIHADIATLEASHAMLHNSRTEREADCFDSSDNTHATTGGIVDVLLRHANESLSSLETDETASAVTRPCDLQDCIDGLRPLIELFANRIKRYEWLNQLPFEDAEFVNALESTLTLDREARRAVLSRKASL